MNKPTKFELMRQNRQRLDEHEQAKRAQEAREQARRVRENCERLLNAQYNQNQNPWRPAPRDDRQTRWA